MKRGWTEMALGEVLTVDIDAVPVDPTQSYPFAGVYGFGRGLFTREPVGGGDTTYSHFHRLHAGQVVMSQPKGWEGAITVVPGEFEGRFLSSVFPTFSCDSSRLDTRFMRLITKCPWLWDELLAKSNGIGARRNAVYPQNLLDVRVSLPPLAEQQRIVARLDAIETRLNRVQQLREEQTKELQAALRSAFHRLVASADWKPLAEVAPLAWRQVAIEPETTYTEFGIRSFYKGIFLRRKVSGSVFDWQELYRLKEGDIVFSNIMAWEKAIAVAGAEHDGWVGNHRMLVCEPRKDVISASCLLHYFMTEEGFAKILQASPGTAARNKTLKADRLMEIEVPVPPLADQREFQKLLALQTQVSARAAESEAAATALLPSLLDQAFKP